MCNYLPESSNWCSESWSINRAFRKISRTENKKCKIQIQYLVLNIHKYRIMFSAYIFKTVVVYFRSGNNIEAYLCVYMRIYIYETKEKKTQHSWKRQINTCDIFAKYIYNSYISRENREMHHFGLENVCVCGR